MKIRVLDNEAIIPINNPGAGGAGGSNKATSGKGECGCGLRCKTCTRALIIDVCGLHDS